MTTSPESEIAVVGAIILDGSKAVVAKGIVSADDFIDRHLGEAFTLLSAMHDEGLPTNDETLLVERFRRAGILEPLGGAIGIVKFFAACPNADFIEFYAGDVKAASTRRKLKALADTIVRRAEDPTADPLQLIEWTAGQLERYGSGGGGGSRSRYVSGAVLLDGYLSRIQSGNLPQLLRLGTAIDGLEIGSELVTIIGAPPGFGKTALAMQVLFEALENQSELVGYVANAEMGFDAIARRELTRLTRPGEHEKLVPITSDRIRFGNLNLQQLDRVTNAALSIRSALSRVQFDPEPNHEGLLDLLDKPPGLIIVDYIQKFVPAEKDVRVGVGIVMNTLRRLAKAGHAVVALSATKRDAKGGHNSADLSLSSFKESGEVEYQADSAYVLRDDGPIEDVSYHRKITLAHVKNRHGAKIDRELKFDMPAMAFERIDLYGDGPQPHPEFEEYATAKDGGFDFGGDQ